MKNVQENDFLIDVLKKLDFFSTENAIENDFPEIVFTKNPPTNLHPITTIPITIPTITNLPMFIKYILSSLRKFIVIAVIRVGVHGWLIVYC